MKTPKIKLHEGISQPFINKFLIHDERYTTQDDMITEIIFDWAISSEDDKTYNAALSYIYDELINEPDDYDFTMNDLCLYLLKYFA